MDTLDDIIAIKVLDNNEFEVVDTNGDTSIHKGSITDIFILDETMTITYK